MLSKSELMEVQGGSVKWIILTVGGAIASFLIGFVDGYTRPLACNRK